MARKRYTAEQIITKLREAEVELAKGQTTSQVCKKLGITDQTYYRWRKEYGGLRVDQAKRLKQLERCCQTDSNQSKFPANSVNLPGTELAPFGESGASIQLEVFS